MRVYASADATEIRLIDGPDPGVRLALRRRRPAGLRRGVVLFVHGATLASELFDIPAEGASWLARAAAGGRDAFALDIRGYGRSSRPAWFDDAPTHHAPYARAADAIRDIDTAVTHIRAATGADRIDLVGGSWGSVTCGLYAATIGRPAVRRLVLYAPLYSDVNADWLAMIADPMDPSRPNPALGAWRWVDEAGLRARWDAEIPVADKTAWRPEATFRALVDSALAADPLSATRTPPAFRAPNGTLLDLFEVFNRRPLYDAAAITAPTLLLRGADDPTSSHADATALFERLRCPAKQYHVIGNGSHFCSAERNAPQVFAAAEAFLSLDLVDPSLP